MYTEAMQILTTINSALDQLVFLLRKLMISIFEKVLAKSKDINNYWKNPFFNIH
jgi:hypothetical protein